MNSSRVRDDSGVTLLVVLVFTTLVGVLATMLLSITQVSFESSASVHDARQRTYALEGASRLAMHAVLDDRTGDLGSLMGSSCDRAVHLNGHDVEVGCQPEGDSSAWSERRPHNAILTLSGAPDALTVDGNHDMTVGGRVYSVGDITTGQTFGTLTSTWSVRTEGAGGECSTAKVVTPTAAAKQCDQGESPAGNDPGWARSQAAGTATLVSCTPYAESVEHKDKDGGLASKGTGGTETVKVKLLVLSKPSDPSTTPGESKGPTTPEPPSTPASPADKKTAGIARFSPGVYGASPVDLLPSDSPCRGNGSTLYFEPGVHELRADFTNETSDKNNSFHVVAGSVPATGSWLSAKSAPPMDGTACDANSDGARFLLGTGGSITVTNAVRSVTLCGAANVEEGKPVSPAIAVQGAAAADSGTVLRTQKQAWVFVHGALHLPTSVVSLTLHNRQQTTFSGGIVAYRLIADVSASTKQLDAPIYLADCSKDDPCRGNRAVRFTATIKGSDGLALVSVLEVDDAYGQQPNSGRSLLRWSHRR